ncbi:MAG: CAP domain-containing protein [Scytolyngbya sp. HA4215-MV1]|jgi:uncharacterized protein YkwD|nr:CAP domain-containing protein [Scytolyngbya sp. HA4215-MV1]
MKQLSLNRYFLGFSSFVLPGLLLMAQAGHPESPIVATPQASPMASPRVQPTPETLEQAIFLQVNEYRRSRQLPLLKLDARVSAEARKHSRAMAEGRVPVGHDGLKRRARAIALRGVLVRRVGENVAYIFSQNDPAARAFNGWMRSPGHRQNMEERRYTLTGVGVAQDHRGATYFTQIYVRKW